MQELRCRSCEDRNEAFHRCARLDSLRLGGVVMLAKEDESVCLAGNSVFLVTGAGFWSVA